MATKLSSLDLEISHFNNFKNYLPNTDSWCWETIENLLNMGLIQVSTVAEHAVAHTGGNTVVSEDSHDISNGDDVKLVTACWHREKYDARVVGITGKTGNLRVQVYCRNLNTFYYFVFPHSTYKAVKGIELPFNYDHTPRKTNHWWNWEVDSFEEMSTVHWEDINGNPV